MSDLTTLQLVTELRTRLGRERLDPAACRALEELDDELDDGAHSSLDEVLEALEVALGPESLQHHGEAHSRWLRESDRAWARGTRG